MDGATLADRRLTRAAWERFASGDDDVRGIPTTILSSWYRCRDVHRVDPRRAPADGRDARHGPDVDGGVLARLGGLASEVADRHADCLATVTDGAGRILASWGSSAVRRRGERSHMAPSYGWSEATSGTNGMGTALVEGTVVSVCGPQHWCEALHGWSCTGVGLRDDVSHAPVAALNVSTWGERAPMLPAAVAAEVASIRTDLRRRAVEDGLAVADEFAAREAAGTRPLVAVDVAGGVVAADEMARRAWPALPPGVAADPAVRWRPASRALGAVVARAVAAATAAGRGWTGRAELGVALGGPAEEFGLVPVVAAGEVVGLLLVGGRSAQGAVVRAAPAGASAGGDREGTTTGAAAPIPQRVAAVRDGRMLLLAPAEIRFAEADRHAVWLVTDLGRLRAATRGIDNVAAELTPFGFARIHRSYLVNVARIREVTDNGRGALTVSTQVTRNERIPVSRRNALLLRETFGL